MAEQPLGCTGVDERDRYPGAGVGPAAAGDQSVQVGVEPERVSRGLRHDDHAGAEAVDLTRRRGHQLGDCLPGRVAEPAEKLPVNLIHVSNSAD